MTDPHAVEREMRDAKVPWPKTEEELISYIRDTIGKARDYGTCVYAMSMCAVATFYYVAHVLGPSWAQAEMAGLDFIRRVRGIKRGFRIVSNDDLVYPQHWKDDTKPIYKKALAENPGVHVEEARRLLASDAHRSAHPRVREHWQYIVDTYGDSP